MPIALLLKSAKPLIAVLLIVGIAGYRALLVRERDVARAQVKALEADKAALLQSNAAMEAAIARQNQAIADLNNEAVGELRRAQAYQAEAAARGAGELRRALDQAESVAASAIAPDCNAAVAWGNAQGPELGRW